MAPVKIEGRGTRDDEEKRDNSSRDLVTFDSVRDVLGTRNMTDSLSPRSARRVRALSAVLVH